MRARHTSRERGRAGTAGGKVPPSLEPGRTQTRCWVPRQVRESRRCAVQRRCSQRGCGHTDRQSSLCTVPAWQAVMDRKAILKRYSDAGSSLTQRGEMRELEMYKAETHSSFMTVVGRPLGMML